jgi:hypothetical protein
MRSTDYKQLTGDVAVHTQVCPPVVFRDGFDERAAFEMPAKGWLSAQIELKDGSRVSVYFSDPVRLQQDLEEEVKLGRPYFAEPGLIVVPVVTVEAVQEAVQALNEQGFFAHLKANQSGGNDNGS